MPTKKPETSGPVEIDPIIMQDITFKIVGLTPLILNRQSEKAKHELLLPSLQKNKAEKAQTLKHNPVEEFQASPYISRNDPKAPTWLHMPSGAFKKCISQAAIDIPGSSKAQIGRLVSLSSSAIHIWGLPEMRADMVRQAGMTKTPDVRFRACIREWATEVTYTYLPAIISPRSIGNLLAAAGRICGIGDYRVEKGAGDYGQFRLAVTEGDGDEEWDRIIAEGGREVQRAAMETPVYYDDETRELVEWFDVEIGRRRNQPKIMKPSAKSKKAPIINNEPPEMTQ